MLTSVICSYIICLCIICLCKYEELYTICDIAIYQSTTIRACDLMTCYIHPVYVYETRISSHSEFLHIQSRYKSFNNKTVNKQQQLVQNADQTLLYSKVPKYEIGCEKGQK